VLEEEGLPSGEDLVERATRLRRETKIFCRSPDDLFGHPQRAGLEGHMGKRQLLSVVGVGEDDGVVS
jgi:hypothetical protein